MKAYKDPQLKIILLEDNDLIATSEMGIYDDETVETQYAGRRTNPIWDD